jgi:tetratricopeptide (TPR) repeat protein
MNNEKPSDAERTGTGDSGAEITAADYIRAMRAHLRNSKPLSAYSVANDALKRYPANPLIVSYHGVLQSVVDKKHRSAVDACRKALLLFKAEDSYSASVVYPHLYLNLGKAYLATGKKKEAVEAFQKGLKYERSNPELKQALRRLGIRKAPLVSFLSRSNPINKLLGMLLNKPGKDNQRRV